MNTTTERIDEQIKSLNDLLIGIQEDRENFRTESERVLQALDYRESKVKEALEDLREAFNRPVDVEIPVPVPEEEKESKVQPMSISKERLEQVQKFLAKKKEARQADIVASTRLNSGSVSVALRKLQESGKVRMVDRKERGSQVWIAADGNS